MNILDVIGNIGTGAGKVFKQKTVSNLHELRSIKAGANVTVTNNANDITIAAAGGATTTTWEEVVYARGGMYSSSATMNGSYFGGAVLDVEARRFDQDEGASIWYPVHDGYASGTISFRIFGIYETPSSANNNVLRIQARWVSAGDNPDVAYVGGGTSFNCNPVTGAGAWRAFVTSWGAVTADGTYAAGDFLMIKVLRTDSVSDDPKVTNIKIKYTINL